MSIHRFCLAISRARKAGSGWVKSGEQHIIGMVMPYDSTSRRNRGQLASSAISRKPAYHSRPSTPSGTASLIHSDTPMLPSLQRACMKALGNAARRGRRGYEFLDGAFMASGVVER